MEEIRKEEYIINPNQNLDTVRKQFENIVKNVFNEFFSSLNREDVNLKNCYRGYFFDTYTLGTNINKEDITNVYYVELKNTDNIIEKRNTILFAPNYTLNKIRNSIYSIFINNSSKDTLLSMSKDSIYISYFVSEEDKSEINRNEQEETTELNNNKLNNNYFFNFKLIIGESYKNEESLSYGIRYYANYRGVGNIEYPIIFLENFMYKDHLTKNNLINYINYVKFIISNNKKENLLDDYLIETIFYNLPNELLKEKPTIKGYRNILNYIKNYPIQDYLTIDGLYKAFIHYNSKLTFWNAKELIKLLEKDFQKKFA